MGGKWSIGGQIWVYVSTFNALQVNVAETSENPLLCSQVKKWNIGLKQAKTQSFDYLSSFPIFFNAFVFEFSCVEKT